MPIAWPRVGVSLPHPSDRATQSNGLVLLSNMCFGFVVLSSFWVRAPTSVPKRTVLKTQGVLPLAETARGHTQPLFCERVPRAKLWHVGRQRENAIGLVGRVLVAKRILVSWLDHSSRMSHGRANSSWSPEA